MNKSHIIISFMFMLLALAALYSYFFLMDGGRKQPDRAKLVISSEVMKDADKGSIRTGQGEYNCF